MMAGWLQIKLWELKTMAAVTQLPQFSDRIDLPCIKNN
jgi:hypothetical protein